MTTLPSYIAPEWPLIEQLLELADRALPEEEWGSAEQIDAENAFFELLEELSPDLFGEDSAFSAWALKATTPEMIVEALRIAEPLLGEDAPNEIRLWKLRQNRLSVDDARQLYALEVNSRERGKIPCPDYLAHLGSIIAKGN